MLGLDQLVSVLAGLESPAIRVHPQQCTRLRHRRSRCNLCAATCPSQAIVWRAASLEVEPGKCTGCGLCAAVCPTGALEAQNPTNGELVARVQELAKERDWVAFACPRYLEGRPAESGRYLRVNCLGRLDESVLVGAVAVGMRSVWLMDGACRECAQPQGRAAALQAVQRANALLAAYGHGGVVRMAAELPPELRSAAVTPAGSLSRRELLSLMTHQTARKAAVAVGTLLDRQAAQAEDAAPKKGELPKRLPAKRRLLLAALKRLGTPSGAAADTGLWARVLLKDNCNGCTMCAFFCPTGALTKTPAGLSFRLAECTNCRLCEEICHWQALRLVAEADLGKVTAGAAEALPAPNVMEPGSPSFQERIARSLLETLEGKKE